MYFYLTHSLVGKDDNVFNVRTILIGVSLYVLNAFLFYSGTYKGLIHSSFLFSTIRDSFLWILAVDVLAMVAVFKLQQGRTILKEVQENRNMASSEEDVHEEHQVGEDMKVEKEEASETDEDMKVDEIEVKQEVVEEVASDKIEVEEVDEDLEAKKE